MRWSALFGLCVVAFSQTPPVASESKGLPPRAAPSDYQAHAQTGAFTIAADFTGHSVGTLEGALTTEDFVVVEAGIFGPPDARLTLSVDDFSLRINGKKALPSQPYTLVLPSLKDPEWEPPSSTSSGSGSKTKLTGGGKDDQADPHAPPPPVIIPVEVRRAMEQRVRKASLPLGDRGLPQAGLLFFPYNGKTQGLRSIELTYSGPAGKATLSIQP